MFDKKNKKIIWAQVGGLVIILVIFIFWAMNLKNVWQSHEQEDLFLKSQEIIELKNTLNEALDNVNKVVSDQKETDKLKSETEEILSNIELPLPSDKEDKQIDCPEWINCMPLITSNNEISEERNCIIPPECEGITQIAY